MKVLLVDPPAVFLSGSGLTRQVEPLGLAYVAAALASADHEVRILLPDTRSYAGDDPWGELALAVVSESPALVGITVVTAALSAAARLTSLVRAHLGPVPVVIGGAHPTADPAGALAATGADFAVLGEGEETVSQLARALASKAPFDPRAIPGLAWCDPRGMVYTSAPRPAAAVLDHLAWPMRDKLVWPQDVEASFYQAVISARGCASSCIYCAAQLMGRGIRHRSVSDVVAEIRHLRNAFGVGHLFFHDSMFSANRRRTLEMCDALGRECRITFDCQTRADCLDRELLHAMAEGGCRHIMLGIESGDPETLRRIRKPAQPDKVPAVVKAIRAAGIRATGFFMVGWPWDDARSMESAAHYACSLGLDAAFLFSVTPLPGTELWGTNPVDPLPDSFDFREPLVNLTGLPDREYQELFHTLKRRMDQHNQGKAAPSEDTPTHRAKVSPDSACVLRRADIVGESSFSVKRIRVSEVVSMASPTAQQPGFGLPGMGAQQGLEQSFVGTVTGIVTRNIRSLPRFLPKNFIWLGVLAGLWLLLMSYPTHKLPAVGSVLVFLTAAYNNFIAKALYIGAINTAIIPRITQARELGAGKVFGAYGRLLGPIARAFGLLGMRAIHVALLYLGAGIAASNLLTRNNSTDKYFVCVLAAFWLLDALAQGAGSMPVRLFRAAYRDITKRAPTYELIYAAFTSAAVGLLLGFVPGMFGRSYWDYKGYIIGAVVMVLGFAAGLAGGKDARRAA